MEKFVATPSDPWLPNFGHEAYFDERVDLLIPPDELDQWDAPVAVERNIVIAGAVTVGPGCTRIACETLQILPGGRLTIGTEDEPRTELLEIVFHDRPIDLDRDPGQYGHGLLVHGEIGVYGEPMTVRYHNDATKNDTSVLVEDVSSDWRVDDEIAILKTSHDDECEHRTVARIETNTIRAADVTIVGGDGVIFDRPLEHEHPGAYSIEGELERRGHVTNETRNIVFRSENPTGIRAHALFGMTSKVDLRYAKFQDMGRTKLMRADDVRWSRTGEVKRKAKNQKARYPCHFHHAKMNAPTVTGCVIDGGPMENHKMKWGLVIHGTNNGFFEHNIVTRVYGAGVVCEDGSEHGNVIHGNTVYGIRGGSSRDLKNGSATGGSGFWFRGVDNSVTDNVVSDTVIGYDLFLQNRAGEPIWAFVGNECYGGQLRALNTWVLVGGEIMAFSAWGLGKRATGTFAYGQSDVTFIRPYLRGPSITQRYSRPQRVLGTSGMTDIRTSRRCQIIDPDIANFTVGVQIPKGYDNVLRGGRISALKSVNITQTVRGRADRAAEIVDVEYLPVPHNPKRHWDVTYQTKLPPVKRGMRGQTLFGRDLIYLTIDGRRYRYYRPEQAADYVIPPPEEHAGLTNAAAWEQFGVCVGGAIIPEGAIQIDGVDGFLFEE